jgi:uncharacterized membrane protein
MVLSLRHAAFEKQKRMPLQAQLPNVLIFIYCFGSLRAAATGPEFFSARDSDT